MLKAWVALQVAVATFVFVLVAFTFRLEPMIAMSWPGLTPEAAIVAGLAFWLIFGLVGGLRARLRPGGAVITFSMPFIVAGTILGGPLAGALMGLVSEFEVREIETQPWYGTLANHAVSIIAAVGAALVGGPVLVALDQLIPGQAPLAFFIAALATAFTFDAINVVLVVPTLALRHGLSIREAAHTPDASFRTMAIAEGILAWNLAAVYLLVGWWAAIAVVALVLFVWQAHDRGQALRRDPLTGLLNRAGLAPVLAATVEAAQAGRRPAALVFVDLDGFKRVNDTYLERAGDEVIITTARRLLTAVRAMDTVGRLNSAGDEFVLLLDGIADQGAARQVAERVKAAIAEPIRLRTVDAVVGVDASIGVALIERGTDLSIDEVLDLAEARMQLAKALGSQIVMEGADDAAALVDRRPRGPRRTPEPTESPPLTPPLNELRAGGPGPQRSG